jgi:hypothetical protein
MQTTGGPASPTISPARSYRPARRLRHFTTGLSIIRQNVPKQQLTLASFSPLFEGYLKPIPEALATFAGGFQHGFGLTLVQPGCDAYVHSHFLGIQQQAEDWAVEVNNGSGAGLRRLGEPLFSPPTLRIDGQLNPALHHLLPRHQGSSNISDVRLVRYRAGLSYNSPTRESRHRQSAEPLARLFRLGATRRQVGRGILFARQFDSGSNAIRFRQRHNLVSSRREFTDYGSVTGWRSQMAAFRSVFLIRFWLLLFTRRS